MVSVINKGRAAAAQIPYCRSEPCNKDEKSSSGTPSRRDVTRPCSSLHTIPVGGEGDDESGGERGVESGGDVGGEGDVGSEGAVGGEVDVCGEGDRRS